MTTKMNGVTTDLFCTGVIGHPRCNVLKLVIEIPNLNNIIGLRNWFENSKSESAITCEEGLTPSQRPFENGTK